MIGLVLCSIVFVIAFLHFRFLWKFRSLSHIPGPPALPLLGVVLHLRDQKKLLPRMLWLRKLYGPIVKIPIVSNMFLLITDRDVAEFFLRSPKFISKANQYSFLDPWLGKGILNADGEEWQKTRKMVTPAFHFKILEDHLSVFDTACDVLIDIFYDQIGKETCDVLPLVTSFTLDIISETAMGISINVQKNPRTDYVAAMHFMTNVAIRRTLSAWKWNDFLFKYSSDYAKQQNAVRILDDLTVKVITERRKFLLDNYSVDSDGERKKSIFLDILLGSTIDGEPLSDEKIKIEVNNFMFGGHDTTASTISLIIYELANNTEVQNKILDEIKLIFGNDKNRYCTMQDINDMKYTEIFIKEILRFYGPVPFIARTLREDVDYDGIIFPKNLTLVFFLYGINRNPEVFKDPNVFNPDRFLSESTIKPYSFLPFSAGPRNCVGQKYAMYEMKATVARLLRHFEFTSAGPEHKLILSPEMVMKSSNGMVVKIKRRDF